MEGHRLPIAAVKLMAVALFATLASAAASAAPAIASNADACGVVTENALAQAFGLDRVSEQKALLRAPGNRAGVVHDRCRVLAWKGRRPTTAREERAGLRAGTVAKARIETWVADPGPAEQKWMENLPEKLEGLRMRAKAEFIEGAKPGSSFQLPPFGADAAIGYQLATGGLRKLRAFWWNERSGSIVSMNLVERRNRTIAETVRRLGAKIIPGVG